MIVKPSELDFSNKKLSMIIAGVPGIGKTTLALSAPRPLLIDLDHGVSRVEALYRKDTLIADSYQELINDLQSADLSAYESIVLDTGGRLFEMIKPVVISEDAQNGKRDGNLSLKGYGAAKRKFAEFLRFLKSLDKNIIIIFHATEVNLENDLTGLRIRIEGSSRDDVWDDIDIGGFMQIIGKKRTISFDNCERFYAKGTQGVHGTYEIPLLDKGNKNNFLTSLFNQIKEQLNNEVKLLNVYNKLMSNYLTPIKNAPDAAELNRLYNLISGETHLLTSKEELWFALTERAKELNLTFNKEERRFA